MRLGNHTKAILLDFDGTIIDADAMLGRIWSVACARQGHEISVGEAADRVRGRAAVDVVAEIMPTLTTSERLRFLQQLEAEEEIAEYALMQGCETFIRRVKQHRIQIGIVTSSWTAKVDNVLRRYRLDDYIDFMITRDDVHELKPSAAPYELAIERSGCTSGDIVAVEDSYTGVLSAKRAGLYCIAITSMRNDVEKAGADAVITSFDDIEPF